MLIGDYIYNWVVGVISGVVTFALIAWFWYGWSVARHFGRRDSPNVSPAGRPGNANYMIAEGVLAPGYRAPTNKGQTLSHASFVERVPVVLFFLDSLDGADDQLELDGFDDLLVEFGHRRVQLLGVAPATPRAAARRNAERVRSPCWPTRTAPSASASAVTPDRSPS